MSRGRATRRGLLTPLTVTACAIASCRPPHSSTSSRDARPVTIDARAAADASATAVAPPQPVPVAPAQPAGADDDSAWTESGPIPVGTPLRVVVDHSITIPHARVQIEIVDHPDRAVRDAMRSELRDWATGIAADFEGNVGLDLRCTATLALSSIVSYVCIGRSHTRRAEIDPGVFGSLLREHADTLTWAIDGSELRDVAVEQAIAATPESLAEESCRRREARFINESECDPIGESAVAMSPRGIVVVYRRASFSAETHRGSFTWREMGALVRPHGPLARVPGATEFVRQQPQTIFHDEDDRAE